MAEQQKRASRGKDSDDGTSEHPPAAQNAELVDEELDDLLDSALQDFEKPVAKKADDDASKSKDDGSTTPAAALGGSGDQPHPWTAEFGQFADVMQGLLREDPQLQEQFTRIAQSANRAASAASDEEFAATLNETLRSISDTAIAFGDPPTEEELSRLVGSMGLDGNAGSALNGGDVPGLVTMMQGMMQNLLSKDLLYPALRDIVDKYPDWLADKRSSLADGEYERYNQQFGLMRRVCEEFEAEQASDAAEVKQARFERVLSLMQKMQECGHPPKDLVEIGPDIGLDEHGNMRVPGMPEQCAIM
ncbi:hypothetical protein V5799_022827 [Amblyomma americanum]|uniref:Peroxin-19 n=1 Tax=Amblyomma americanum TaxID=6943 RepID=A0AAQ4FLE3_AMBAM